MIPRDTVFSETRRSDVFGAPDDFHSIVNRRLVALGYLMNDQGDVVDESGNVIVAADDDTGTGTPAQLAALGYTPQQIAIASGSVSGNVSGAAPAATLSSPVSTSTPTGTGSTSWLSGLSSLFGTVGNTVSSVVKATSTPAINPATGKPYATTYINPATGLPYTTAAATGSVSALVIVVAGVVLWLVFGKK
jgi:hypothetical protein